MADIKTVGTRQVKLQEIASLDEYDVVTVTSMVIAVNEPQKVGQAKLKQEMIADITGTAAVHLWEHAHPKKNLPAEQTHCPNIHGE